jgi:nucleotide-binding universal stress UspA family protein
LPIRTILAAASGGSASKGAIELACRLAVHFRAHVEGFHVVVDPREMFALAGEDLGMAAAGLFESVAADAKANSIATKAIFDETVARYGLLPATIPQPRVPSAGPSAIWCEETGYAPYLVPARARFFDLIVLGRSERVIREAYTDTIEQTLVQSGRPVLLAPPEPSADIGKIVAVAWNGSPEAARAVSAAMPLLGEANTVWVITVGDEAASSSKGVVEYLAWHGIAAEHRGGSGPVGASTGTVLLETARDNGADLLIMGGYSHRPWREALFGGATHEVVGSGLMPILLVH